MANRIISGLYPNLKLFQSDRIFDKMDVAEWPLTYGIEKRKVHQAKDGSLFYECISRRETLYS